MGMTKTRTNSTVINGMAVSKEQQYLWEVTIECMRELDALNIPYGKVREVTINTRAKRRWGQCREVRGLYYISISDRLLENKDGLKNTIIHELLHTCPNCMNHKEPWKAVASKVNKAYGYNIKRCSGAEEKGVEPVEYKYVFKCKKCGVEVKQMRASKFTRNPRNYKCGCCGGEFERVC